MSKHISLPRSRMWRTRAATALAAAGALVMSGGMVMLNAGTATAAPTKVHKSYICKYVSTPGEGEVLQSGDNPIWVDNNAIPGNHGGDVEVEEGDSFADGQVRSVVIVANTRKLVPEPGIGDCPSPNDGNDESVPYKPIREIDKCGTQNDELKLPQSPDQNGVTYEPTVDGLEWSVLITAPTGKTLEGTDGLSQKTISGSFTDEPCSDQKIGYCHWDEGNGYENNSNAAVEGLINGHMDHEKDIWPAFDYDGVHYDAQGDQSVLQNGCVVPEDTDVCSDIEGPQSSIPAGYHRGDNNTCVPDETDLCLNLPDVQTSVPAGYVRNNDGTCTPPPPPPTDVCPNIRGMQASVPAGYQLIEGDCVEILGVQKIAPTVSFTNPDCEHLNRAKWSGNLTDLVDYTVSGTPGRGNSVTVTANIKPAVADEFAFVDGFDNTFDHSYPSKADLNCPTVKGSESVQPKPHKTRTPTVLGTQAVAPTAVDAGLATLPGDTATSTTSLLAQLMVAGGLLLLLAGGWLGLGRREDGAHQA